METSFWIQKWEKNETAFHLSEANPILVKYFEALSLAKGSRVFLPLCGKTRDIAWLLSNGYRVAGSELSQLAVEQLFEELGERPKITSVGNLQHYSADDVDIFMGDFFDLNKEILGPVDAVYDRAALVALPEKTRKQYTAHLIEITDKASQLLICYEYDQTSMEGPPFSISREEVMLHYSEGYSVNLIASTEESGLLKDRCEAMENVWLLKSKMSERT